MQYGEFEFIDRIRKLQSNVPLGVEGIGDDAAVIPAGNNKSFVITTDSLVQNIHFKLEWATPYQIGRKSAAVNISDIAAMGAKPLGLFLSVSLPSSVDTTWMDGFISGINSFGLPLLGGDTTSSKEYVYINVTAIGETENSNIKRRSTAKSGDGIYVTGNLGDSGAGLYILQNGINAYPSLVDSHLNPSPRVKEGIELGFCSFVHSMMDVSDGLAGDIRHIMELSNLSASIDCSLLPLSEDLISFCNEYSLDPIKFALESGEDYQLLFSAEQKNCLPLHAIKVGTLYEGPGELRFLNVPEGSFYKGYTHF